MAAPIEIDPDLDKELLIRARQAAKRWEDRGEVRRARTEALENNELLQADSPSRLAMRMNNLIDDVRRSSLGRRSPSNPALKRLVDRATPVVPEDLNADLVREVVLNAREFLSIEFLERGLLAAHPVGRILIRSGSGLLARGTGFLVAPGLALTNEHVLPSEDIAAACAIEMDYEQNRLGPVKTPQIFFFEPKRFYLVDATLDFALVAVADRSDRGARISSYGWLPLNGAQGKIAVLDIDYLNIIQHPLGREKEVVLRENRVLDLRTGNEQGADAMGPFIHYEADTEKGSSGSPVLNDQWDVLALHHTGVPKRDAQGNWLDKDGHIWRESEQPVSRIQWIANEGVRVSSLVAAVINAQVKPEQRDLLARFLSARPANAVAGPVSGVESGGVPQARENPGDTAVRGGAAGNITVSRGTMSFDVPLRITVSLGETGDGGGALTIQPSTGGAELLAERLDPQDYADRGGYDRHFLGAEVPLPAMKPAPRFGNLLRVPRPARPEDVNELRYHHYSVLMNEKRRLAYVSACNVDFNPGATITGDAGGGSWKLDSRLDSAQQMGPQFYDGGDSNPYDKGHLTRRDDAAWGRDKDEAVAANKDSYHYTNAAPQHRLFNQPNHHLDLWGDLEEFISDQGSAQRTRLSIFNGPIFGMHDKPLRGALAPFAFFKIVIWRDGNAAPAAIGFVLEQTDLIAHLAEEAIDPGRFKIHQRPISAIEALVDVSFGPVTGFDVLAANSANAAPGGAAIPIERVANIRLTR